MSLAVVQPAAEPAPSPRRGGAWPAVRGRLTLDEVISGAWAGLCARVPVACPACGGRMAPAGEQAGRCGSCSASLS